MATKIVSFPKCTLGRKTEQNLSPQGGHGCFALEMWFEMEIGITLLRN